MAELQLIIAALGGALVGFSLALVGGGGSILAVPILVYAVGVRDPHIAIGTSAVGVAANALIGLIGKALLVVPGHCLAQASREFLQLYPTASILVADDTNFAAAKRLRFMARAATGESSGCS